MCVRVRLVLCASARASAFFTFLCWSQARKQARSAVPAAVDIGSGGGSGSLHADEKRPFADLGSDSSSGGGGSAAGAAAEREWKGAVI